MTGVDMGEGQQAKYRALNDEDEDEEGEGEGAETSSVDSQGEKKVKRIRKSQAPRADAGQLMLQAQLQTE